MMNPIIDQIIENIDQHCYVIVYEDVYSEVKVLHIIAENKTKALEKLYRNKQYDIIGGIFKDIERHDKTRMLNADDWLRIISSTRPLEKKRRNSTFCSLKNEGIELIRKHSQIRKVELLKREKRGFGEISQFVENMGDIAEYISEYFGGNYYSVVYGLSHERVVPAVKFVCASNREGAVRKIGSNLMIGLLRDIRNIYNKRLEARRFFLGEDLGEWKIIEKLGEQADHIAQLYRFADENKAKGKCSEFLEKHHNQVFDFINLLVDESVAKEKCSEFLKKHHDQVFDIVNKHAIINKVEFI